MEPTVEVQFQIELEQIIYDLSITVILMGDTCQERTILILNVYWECLNI